MIVSISDATKVFTCAVDTAGEKVQAKKAGFVWNPLQSRLESSKLTVAAALRSHHDEKCRKLFKAISCEVLEPWSGGISIPTSERLDKAQRMGVRDAMERNHFYAAFEQGVGKTPTGVALINTYGEKCIVLTPPHLTSMWREQIRFWQTRNYRIASIDKAIRRGHQRYDIIIVPDNTITDPEVRAFLNGCTGYPLLIVEEAQRFLNWGAKRTDALFGPHAVIADGFVHNFEKVLFLSGTPVKKCSMELHPVLSKCAANVINYRDYHDYGVHYCAGRSTRFGWEYRGVSNWEELRRKMHGLFMRREEITDKFVPVKRKIVFLDGVDEKIIDLEKAVLKGRSIKEFIKEYQTSGSKEQDLGLIARYRKAVAKRKVPLSAEWLHEKLTRTKKQIVLFGWHIEAINEMARRLRQYNPVVVHGAIDYGERDRRIAAFKAGEHRVLIGNIQVMVGYDIPEASLGAFFEISWDHTDNEQAWKRIHRRTSKLPVLVYYLILEKSFEEYILETNFKKRTVIDKLISKPKPTHKGVAQ